MKLLIPVIAFSFAFATPAFAQSAPTHPHAGHEQKPAQPSAAAPGVCTAEHAGMGHCKPDQGGPAAPGPLAGQAHDGDCCKKDANGKMVCCEKAPAAGKDCCDKDEKAPTGAVSDHSGH